MTRLIKNSDIILDGTLSRAEKEKQAFEKLSHLELVCEICEKINKQGYYYDYRKQRHCCEFAYYDFVNDEIIVANTYDKYPNRLPRYDYETCGTDTLIDERLSMNDYQDMWYVEDLL